VLKVGYNGAIDRMPATNPGVFTVEVRKKDERLEEGPDVRPEGPDATGHPGVGPEHGPDWRFGTALRPGPEGEGTFTRMRGLLARV